jgi:hypothetical protein
MPYRPVDREDSLIRKIVRFAVSCVFLCAVVGVVEAWSQELSVEVLSSFPELVTGGDALVKVGGASSAPTVTIGGTEVSVAWGADGNLGWIGRVDGLSDGDNELIVSSGGSEATLTLRNHPINGTLFAGPQQTPFVCENEAHGLAAATDESCAAPTLTGYFYRSTDGEWKDFDPGRLRPGDIEMTTTMNGKTVPLINWYEKGIINRSAYVISLLHDPAAGPPPTAISNETGWNGKLIMSHRGGVRAAYHMGTSIGTLDPNKGWVGGENNNLHESLIRAGYALAGGSLMVTGTNTNHVVQAETAAKIKERFIELFGPPQFTISMGTSGGSMSQHLIAQGYPGLYDGIMPWRSYPDVLSFNTPINDCNLLVNYFNNTEMAWTDIQMREVSGKVNFGYCTQPATRFPNLSPDNCDASVSAAKTAAPELWSQVRCTYQDNLVNVYGIDPATGFARSPWDNAGVQYGLKAFNDGIITFDQFAQLNVRIGGHGINGVIEPGQRAHANPDAVRIAYETGRLNTGDGGLRTIPILDVRGYTDGICTAGPCLPGEAPEVDVHDGYHSLVTRARLMKANGNIDNHVRLVIHEVGHRGPDSVLGVVSPEAVAVLDEWMTHIYADTSRVGQAEKVAAHRPTDFVDACYTAPASKITDMNRCAVLFPFGTDARMVAGAPPANDVLKCSLKRFDRSDYTRSLTADQLTGLSEIFPEGVCDWTQPGVGQVPLAGTWAFYSGDTEVQYLRPAR